MMQENEQRMVDKTKDPPKRRCSCWKIFFWTSAVVIGLAGILAGYMYMHSHERDIPKELYESLGLEGVQMFMAHDRDGDGYLSIEEYEALYYRFVGRNANMSFEDEIYEQPIEDHDYMVTVESSFKPLDLSTMTKDLDFEISMIGYGELDPLEGLKTWKTPNKDWMNFAVRHFYTFLPPESLYFAVGEVYHLTEEESGIFNFMHGDLSSNRYFPPHVDEKYVTIHRLLTMFHKRPFIMNRFRPRGGVAVIRAKSDKYIEIVFRIHAEFQLNEPPNSPFWFTPAQFTGNLVVSKDLKELLYFKMYVPSTRKLNVDMEWLQGTRGMEVDIGYLPEMILESTGPSIAVKDFNINQNIPRQKYNPNSVSWIKEIPLETALADLELKLYPFKKIQYYNLTESLEIAKKEKKLVHTILLWGALDDQSC